MTGKWQVTAEFYGTPMYAPLQLEQTGTKLTGKFHGDKLEGTVDGAKVHFVAMDFNEVGEGATVYLPVSNPGELLYFGDAHALQGDGELNGNALETSMDVTVDVIQGKHLNGPRVETADSIIAMGLGGG
ncbi:MAG TPA: acetamidase/formamidase family protein, partial [Bryocella sp.]|nr:acetamidase/formamidase family protein [Bryocella sp.]